MEENNRYENDIKGVQGKSHNPIENTLSFYLEIKNDSHLLSDLMRISQPSASKRNEEEFNNQMEFLNYYENDWIVKCDEAAISKSELFVSYDISQEREPTFVFVLSFESGEVKAYSDDYFVSQDAETEISNRPNSFIERKPKEIPDEIKNTVQQTIEDFYDKPLEDMLNRYNRNDKEIE